MEDSEVKNRYEDFLNGFDSLCMSTVDNEGWPLISYAPFVVDDNSSFYKGRNWNIKHQGIAEIPLSYFSIFKSDCVVNLFSDFIEGKKPPGKIYF